MLIPVWIGKIFLPEGAMKQQHFLALAAHIAERHLFGAKSGKVL
jgi:hypothetical protein